MSVFTLTQDFRELQRFHVSQDDVNVTGLVRHMCVCVGGGHLFC